MNKRASLPRRDLLKALCSIPLAAFIPVVSWAEIEDPLYFVCRKDNDLYGVAKASGVLILSESYPDQTNDVDSNLYQDVAKKQLRLYVEFPSSVPDLSVGKPKYVAYGKYH